MDAGLWIDHRKAVVVLVSEEEETTTLIDANVDAELNKFYDEVIASIRETDAILIFGPGDAKAELRARLVREGLGGLIAGVEAAESMTDRQITAKVRALLER
jgi:hypothetical protein